MDIKTLFADAYNMRFPSLPWNSDCLTLRLGIIKEALLVLACNACTIDSQAFFVPIIDIQIAFLIRIWLPSEEMSPPTELVKFSSPTLFQNCFFIHKSSRRAGNYNIIFLVPLSKLNIGPYLQRLDPHQAFLRPLRLPGKSIWFFRFHFQILVFQFFGSLNL